MAMRLLGASWLLCAAVTSSVSAQTIELVFTPVVAEQAVAVKGALRLHKVDSFNALALVAATPERKETYRAKLSAASMIVIVGEDALKATGEMEFTAPVILVNAAGRIAARNRVVRVFDAEVGASQPSAVEVAPAAIAYVMRSSNVSAFKGEVAPLVQAVVDALK